MTLEAAYDKEINIQLSGNSSGGHSCSEHTNCMLPQPGPLYCVTKLHILEWPLIVPRTRCTCVMIMLFNQFLDMPHLSGLWIILAKEKCSPTRMFLCVWTFLGSFISAHETWDQHFTCSVYIFVQYMMANEPILRKLY